MNPTDILILYGESCAIFFEFEQFNLSFKVNSLAKILQKKCIFCSIFYPLQSNVYNRGIAVHNFSLH